LKKVGARATPAPRPPRFGPVDVLLALDAGTTGIRTLALDPAGRVVEESYRELTQYFPSPGWVEHNPAEIADVAVATLRDVANRVRHRGDRVAALGITNQRETVVAFHRESGHLYHPAIVWQDRRGEALCHSLREAGHEPRVRNTTGLVLDPYFSASKIHWMLERGLVADDASVATIDSWLVWWLTGNVDGGIFVTEPSNASRTLLMDLATLEWAPSMLTLFGISPAMLPVIRPSATHFGVIDANVVPELAGVPITAILGDQQAALFGQACFETGQIKATFGTGSFVVANAGNTDPGVVEGLITTVAWDLGDFGPATYAYEGSAFTAGSAVQWLRDEMGWFDRSEDVGALAATVSDANGCAFVPAFNGLGSPFWRSDARGALMGLSRGVTRAHVARAVLDSLAYQVAAMTESFGTTGLSLHELRCDGGVAAVDGLLDLLSTLTGLRVTRSTSLEATGRGVALLAGMEVGLFQSLDEIAALWTSSRESLPDDSAAVLPAYARWRELVLRA
jgi:glycerol kinase